MKLELDDLDLITSESKVTDSESKEYVLEKFGARVFRCISLKVRGNTV